MLVSFARHTVERLRPEVISDHGNDFMDYSGAVAVPIHGCIVQPATGADSATDRTAVLSQKQVILPPGTDLLPHDHLKYKGVEYQIIGDVQDWDSPTGDLDHLFVTVQRWEG